jgi:hypothetical protein
MKPYPISASPFVLLMIQYTINLCIMSGTVLSLKAQCFPELSETCEDAPILCSLNQLNGYTCNNYSNIASPCAPLCSQGGVGHNTSWWAFQTSGGNITFSIKVGPCISNQGLQYGIWGNCNCSDEVLCRSIACIPPNSVSVSQVTLVHAKTYYFWIDGCSGDICDFTINTSGEGPPLPNTLSPINNIPGQIIDTLCAGNSQYKFFVNTVALCSPIYFWELDGHLLNSNKNEVLLDFPDPGEFKLCVTAYSSINQGQTNTQCITIKVYSADDKIGHSRILCWEEVQPDGKKWHDQKITSSGIYRQQFAPSNDCRFDSLVEFIVLDRPKMDEVIHFTCDSIPFIDTLGRSWTGCRDSFQIILPKFSHEYQCDSTILLTSAFLSVKPFLDVQCRNGNHQLIIHPDFGKLCSVIDSLHISYSWFQKDDPDRNILSISDTLTAIVDNSYCVELNMDVIAHNRFQSNCKTNFCYELKTDSIFNPKTPMGPLTLCSNDIGTFSFDTSFSPGTHYQWTSDQNAVIHSSGNVEAKVSWSQPGIKTLCVTAYDVLNSSCLFCQQVEILKAAQTGRDFKVLGLQTRMKAEKADFGIWKQISGPGKASFENLRDPKSRVKVSRSGRYMFEWGAAYNTCIDKDSVVIDFFTKPIDPTQLIFLSDGEEAEVRNSEKESNSVNEFRFYTPSLIRTSGISFIQTETDLYFEKAEYSWINSSGQNLISGRIENSNGDVKCQIDAPVAPGLFFLVLQIEGQQLVKKVMVMD